MPCCPASSAHHCTLIKVIEFAGTALLMAFMKGIGRQSLRGPTPHSKAGQSSASRRKRLVSESLRPTPEGKGEGVIKPPSSLFRPSANEPERVGTSSGTVFAWPDAPLLYLWLLQFRFIMPSRGRNQAFLLPVKGSALKNFGKSVPTSCAQAEAYFLKGLQER